MEYCFYKRDAVVKICSTKIYVCSIVIIRIEGRSNIEMCPVEICMFAKVRTFKKGIVIKMGAGERCPSVKV